MQAVPLSLMRGLGLITGALVIHKEKGLSDFSHLTHVHLGSHYKFELVSHFVSSWHVNEFIIQFLLLSPSQVAWLVWGISPQGITPPLLHFVESGMEINPKTAFIQ